MKKTILIFCFILFTTASFSQDYIKGKVFIKGDTAYGLIKIKSDRINAIKCTFKKVKSEKSIIYYPGQIDGYELENHKKFVSKKILIENDSIYVFLQVLVNGAVNCYYRKGKEGKPQFFLDDNKNTLELIGETFITNSNGKFATKGNYINILKTTFNNCPPTNKSLDKLHFYKKDIESIATSYNICMKDMTYKYIPQRNKIIFGFKAGYFPIILNVNSPDTYNYYYYSKSYKISSFASEFGFFISHVDPIHRNFLVEVGASILSLNIKNSNSLNTTYPYLNRSNFNLNLVQFPLSIKYILLPRKFSPYLFGGGYFMLNANRNGLSNTFNESNISSNYSGFHIGGGIKLDKGNKEYKLEYKFQKIKVSGNGSDSEFRFTAHSICFTFGWIKN